jgi:foldase protein PrsA
MTPTFLALFAFLAPASFAQDRELVRVNGTPILQSEVVARLLKRYGDSTVDELINELLLRQAAKTEKVKAEPKEIEDRLSRIKATFPEGGFERQLKGSGMTVDALKDELADQIVQEKAIAQKNKLSVGEDEVKKFFNERKSELGRPAAIRLRHILVKDEAEAKKLAERIKKGEDFEKLARENSLAATGKLTGGDYGFVTKGMLPPDIEKVAFSLKKGELKTLADKTGGHILQAVDTRPALAAEFSKVKDELREMLLTEKIKQALPDYLRELRQKADIKPMAGS